MITLIKPSESAKVLQTSALFYYMLNIILYYSFSFVIKRNTVVSSGYNNGTQFIILCMIITNVTDDNKELLFEFLVP